MVIKNTYRTLMTRGMRACRVFCTDQETGVFSKANYVMQDIFWGVILRDI